MNENLMEPFVQAPGGPRPQSLVHKIPDGHRLHVENDIVYAVDEVGNKKTFPPPSKEALDWVERTSAPRAAVAKPVAPTTPTGATITDLRATVVGTAEIGLIWTPVQGSSGTVVYRRASPFGDLVALAWIGYPGNSYRDTPQSGTNYTYVVAPYDHGVVSPEVSATTLTITDGWQAFAQATLSNPVTALNVSFNVPSTPAWGGQTLFYFPCTSQDITGSTLLQPVLQYGASAAGGNGYWSIASWYMKDWVLYYTSAIPVPPAVKSLLGKISVSAGTATVSFDGYPDTSISITDPRYSQNVWAAMAVESYFLTRDLSYVAGDCTFKVQSLATTTSQNTAVNWTATNWFSGATAKIANNGTPNASVLIHTPHAPGG